MGRHLHIHRKRLHMKNKHVSFGGSVPVLLSNVLNVPVQEGSSNRFVGIITPQPARAAEGGKLLRHINFGHAKKADKESRIKFIF